MILFFGTRLRRRHLGTGTFACPFCAAARQYELVGARTWAHVFWIPLFPLGREMEALQCTVCHGEWSTALAGDPLAEPAAGT